jgi:hypothetical protein
LCSLQHTRGRLRHCRKALPRCQSGASFASCWIKIYIRSTRVSRSRSGQGVGRRRVVCIEPSSPSLAAKNHCGKNSYIARAARPLPRLLRCRDNSINQIVCDRQKTNRTLKGKYNVLRQKYQQKGRLSDLELEKLARQPAVASIEQPLPKDCHSSNCSCFQGLAEL